MKYLRRGVAGWKQGRRAVRETVSVKRWRAMGYDTFARESYCVGEYATGR